MDAAKQEKQAVQRCAGRAASGVFSQSGVSLLIILISILVLAVLAAGMYALTSTSIFNQVSSQKTMRAFYLAEAGPRIVVSEYRGQAPGVNRINTLLRLNGSTFNAGGGTIKLDIYPYWFYAVNPIAIGTRAVTLNLAGNVPRAVDGVNHITFPARGILKLVGETSVAQYTAVAIVVESDTPGTPSSVQFTVPAGIPYTLAANDELVIGFVQNENGNPIFTNGQNVNLTGDLVINTTGNIAAFLPSEDGYFSLALPDHIYQFRYDRRQTAAGITTLTNIQCAVAGQCPNPFTVIYKASNLTDPAFSTHIYLGKVLVIRSTGTFVN